MVFGKGIPFSWACMLLTVLLTVCVLGGNCRTITIDPGSGETLRGALHAETASVLPGDVVHLRPGVYTGEESCGLEILKPNISIFGDGSGTTVVDCQGTNMRPMAVLASDITVHGIHFANGTCDGGGQCLSGDGGALFVSSPGVHVIDCNFSNSFASAHGGGISVSSSAGYVYLENIIISQCSSVRGGGLWSDSSRIALVNSLVSFNTATAHGGGVYVFAADLTISKSSFVGNSGFFWGGAVFNIYALLTVEGARFEFNTAAYWGAAIAIHSGTTAMISQGSEFVQNSAGMEGGALLAAWGSRVDIMDDTRFEANYADYDGGAVYVGPLWLSDNAGCEINIAGRSVFMANRAGQSGGAVAAERCHVSIGQDAVLEGNRAEDRGGAVYAFRHVNLAVGGNVQLRANSAKSAGGAIAVVGAHKGGQEWAEAVIAGNVSVIGNAALVGGGLWMHTRATLRLEGDAIVRDNSAQSSGGGLAANVESLLLVAGQATIRDNRARQGGGVEVEDGARLNVSGAALVAGNSAEWRGGGVAVLPGGAMGGDDQAALVNNRAEGAGAAVFATHRGMVHLAPSVALTGNRAGAGGEVDEQADGVCGDGRLSTGEAVPPVRPGLDAWGHIASYCDDGNAESGDGCSSVCTVEAEWVCGGGGPRSPDECVPDVCGDGQQLAPVPVDPEAMYPSTCEGYRKHYNQTTDGEYTLFLERTPSMPITIYCHDMARTPKEYLTLPRPETNYVTWGEASTRLSRSHFEKVRVTLHGHKVFVNQMDYTFAGDLASMSKQPWFVSAALGDRPRYGNALSCDGQPKGARLDLRGLPVSVEPQEVSATNVGGQEVGKVYELLYVGWCQGYTFTRCLTAPDGEAFCMSLEYEATVPTGQCDDGNRAGGDGCSATCQEEEGFTCEHNSGSVQQPSRCSCACGEGQCESNSRASGSRCFALAPGSPQTLPEVLAKAAQGDRVHLAAGRYLRQHCGGRLSVSGVAIAGAGMDRTVVDCAQDSALAPPLRFLEVHAHGTHLRALSVLHSSASSDGGALSVRPTAMRLFDASQTVATASDGVPLRINGWSHALRTDSVVGGEPEENDLAVAFCFWLKTKSFSDANSEFARGDSRALERWNVFNLTTQHSDQEPFTAFVDVASNKIRYCAGQAWKVDRNTNTHCIESVSTVVDGWNHVCLEGHALAHRQDANKTETNVTVEMYLNAARLEWIVPAGWRLGVIPEFPPGFSAASVAIGQFFVGQSVGVAVEVQGLHIWRRALLGTEREWLVQVTHPERRASGPPQQFNRDHLRPSYDPTLDPAVVFAAGAAWEGAELEADEVLQLKGREAVPLRVGGSQVLGGELTFSLWAKLARPAPNSTLLELSEIETLTFPFSNAILLTVQDDGRVRYRLWQDPWSYPMIGYPSIEATAGRVRPDCFSFETNASKSWFVDSREVLPVGVWTQITVVHADVAAMFWDGVEQASAPIPQPAHLVRHFVSVGRSSESTRPNKFRARRVNGDLFGPDDIEAAPGVWVHARGYDLEIPLLTWETAELYEGGYGAYQPVCGRAPLTFQGSISGVRVWNTSLSSGQVQALASLAAQPSLPLHVPLLGRVRVATVLREVAIRESQCVSCDGGAVYVGRGALLRVADCSFTYNTAAAFRGGAVASRRGDEEASVLVMASTEVRGCQAREGGGVYWEGGNRSWVRRTSSWPREPIHSVELTASSLSGNVAEHGGAVRLPQLRASTRFSTTYMHPYKEIRTRISVGPSFFATADGKYLYVGSKDRADSSGWDHRGLVRFDTATGEAETVLPHFVGGGKPKPSPDGKFSYWVTASNSADTFYPGSTRSFVGLRKTKEGVYRLDMVTWKLELIANTTHQQTVALAPTPDASALFYHVGPALFRVNLHSPADSDIDSFCGSAVFGYADGTCAGARFGKIADLVADGGGRWLYVAENQQHVVRRVDLERREVETLLGSGRSGDADGFGRFAEFSGPVGLAWSRNMLFVQDMFGDRIRRVDLLSHYVETIPMPLVETPFLDWWDDNLRIEFSLAAKHMAGAVPAQGDGPLGLATVLRDLGAGARRNDDPALVTESIAIHVTEDGTIFYKDDTVTRDYYVGPEIRALHTERDGIVIDRSVFRGNRAEHGGALSLVDNLLPADITSSTFLDNKAATAGGAIHLAGSAGSVGLGACVVRGNAAATHGGGVFAEASYHLRVANTSVEANQAARGGGLAVDPRLLSSDLGLKLSTQAEEVTMMLRAQSMQVADVKSHLHILNCSFTANRADMGAALASLGNGSTVRIAATDLTSNVAAECGSGLLLSSRQPVDVEGPVRFLENVALQHGSAICLAPESNMETDSCNAETRDHAMMLRSSRTQHATLTFSDNKADMGGLLFLFCRDSGDGASTDLAHALHAVELSGGDPSLVLWPPQATGAEASLTMVLSGNSAGYGVLAGSPTVTWALDAADSAVSVLPGTRAPLVLRQLDVVGSTVQSASRPLPQSVQLRMCHGEACATDTEYHLVVSLFPAGDGRLRWQTVDGAEVLAVMSPDGSVAASATLALTLVGGSSTTLPEISAQVHFEEPGPGQQYVTRRQWKGLALVSVEPCAADQYIVDPKRGQCVNCPEGARCDGSEARGKVADSVWTKVASAGLAMLESCPPGHTLINSTVGTSQGVFSHEIQQCRPCGTHEYVVDPNRFPCQPCPLGAECDGQSLVTRDGLDALGARWDASAEGVYVLVECPVGYRMVSAAERGLENQQCVKCGVNEFVASSTTPFLECQPCPISAFCPSGGPPVFSTPRRGTLSVAQAGSSEAEVRRQLVEAIAAEFDLLITLVVLEGGCGSNAADCESAPTGNRRRADPAEDRTQSLRFRGRRAEEPALTYTYTLHFPRDRQDLPSGDEVASALAAVVREQLQLAGSAAAQDTEAMFGVSEVELRQWEYEVLETGGVVLVDCPVGYILVNASTNQPTCTPCPPTSYSLSPFDNCAGAECPPRSCTSCPQGANCQGKSHFESRVEGAEWEEAVHRRGDGALASVNRLVACPAGFVLVRTESLPQGDECVECPTETYSLESPRLPLGLAAGDAVATGADASALRWCLPCPVGSVCAGGASVVPAPGFWRHREDMTCAAAACDHDNGRERCQPRQCLQGSTLSIGGVGDESQMCEGNATSPDCRLRAVVVVCPPGVCEEDGVCKAGHEGAACGVCSEGYTKASQGCHRCSEEDRERAESAFVTLASLLFIFVWLPVCLGPVLSYVLWGWTGEEESASNGGAQTGSANLQPQPRPGNHERPAGPENEVLLAGSDAPTRETGSASGQRQRDDADHQGLVRKVAARLVQLVSNRAPIAVLIAAFQVLAAFGSMYRIRWEESLQRFLQYSSASNLDILSLPGFVCLFQGVSFRARVLFSSVAPLIAVAIHVVLLASIGLAAKLLFDRSVSMALQARLRKRFWSSLVFFGIIFYPVLSVVALKPLQCNWELGLAVQDFREHCPSINGGFVFYWSIVFAVVYPFCIPASMLAALVLHKVPSIARRKQEDAYIRGLHAYLTAKCSPLDKTASTPTDAPRCPSTKRKPPDAVVVRKSGNRFRLHRHRPVGEGKRSDRGFELAQLSREGRWNHQAKALEATRQELITLCIMAQELPTAPGEPDLDNMSTAAIRSWLHRHAKHLESQNLVSMVEPCWDAEEDKVVMTAVGGLFTAYKVRFWYWELVEMLRKVTLATAVPILLSDSTTQITAGLLVIFAVTCVVIGWRPYRLGFLSYLQAGLHVVLYCVLYSGLEI